MFSKANKSAIPGKGNGREIGAAPSIISANLQVVGILKTDGEIQIDGIVDGDVSGRSLTVGEKAKVTGEITVDELMVRGIVEGRIRAHEVQLAKTGKVIGDIWHDVLSIESGAYIEGHCRRMEKSRESCDKKLNLMAPDAVTGKPVPAFKERAAERAGNPGAPAKTETDQSAADEPTARVKGAAQRAVSQVAQR